MENSCTAFGAAIKAGYGIELDVQMSADGHAMVFHDYDLFRLTGISGAIRTFSRDQLTKIKLLGCTETIPTLPEILKTVAGRVPLLIETKDQDGAMGPDVGPMEQSVARALQNYTGPVGVMSFNPHSVAELAKHSPDTPRGLVTCHFPAEHWQILNEKTRARLREIPDYDRIGACFISHRHDDLDNPHVARLKASGAGICCWTVRSKAEEVCARKYAETITFEGYKAEITA
ncbi:MAG TPA: phosphodiesterase [Rhodobacteraceae bacterium]|nr:phosphodiesterase [Paracoccaceae bacterium]